MWDIILKYFDFKTEMDWVGLHKELIQQETVEATELSTMVQDLLVLNPPRSITTGEPNYWVKKFILLFYDSVPGDNTFDVSNTSERIETLSKSTSTDQLKYQMCVNVMLLNLYNKGEKQVKAFECMLNYQQEGIEEPRYFKRLVELLIGD